MTTLLTPVSEQNIGSPPTSVDDEVEPPEDWKVGVRSRIELSLHAEVERYRTERDDQLRDVVQGSAQWDAVTAVYNNNMHRMRMRAQDMFNTELKLERFKRSTALGREEESPEFAELRKQQQAILDQIRKEKEFGVPPPQVLRDPTSNTAGPSQVNGVPVYSPVPTPPSSEHEARDAPTVSPREPRPLARAPPGPDVYRPRDRTQSGGSDQVLAGSYGARPPRSRGNSSVFADFDPTSTSGAPYAYDQGSIGRQGLGSLSRTRPPNAWMVKEDPPSSSRAYAHATASPISPGTRDGPPNPSGRNVSRKGSMRSNDRPSPGADFDPGSLPRDRFGMGPSSLEDRSGTRKGKEPERSDHSRQPSFTQQTSVQDIYSRRSDARIGMPITPSRPTTASQTSEDPYLAQISPVSSRYRGDGDNDGIRVRPYQGSPENTRFGPQVGASARPIPSKKTSFNRDVDWSAQPSSMNASRAFFGPQSPPVLPTASSSRPIPRPQAGGDDQRRNSPSGYYGSQSPPSALPFADYDIPYSSSPRPRPRQSPSPASSSLGDSSSQRRRRNSNGARSVRSRGSRSEFWNGPSDVAQRPLQIFEEQSVASGSDSEDDYGMDMDELWNKRQLYERRNLTWKFVADEQRRVEAKRLEEEAARKREEEARRQAEEMRRLEEEVQRKAFDLKHKEEEIRRREAELLQRETEAKLREERRLREEAEARLQEEIRKRQEAEEEARRRQREDDERLAREDAERKAQEERERQDREAREKLEEDERLERERREKEETERREKEERQRRQKEERERREKEKRERQEKAREEKERQQKEKREKEEKERREKEEQVRREKEERERRARELKDKLEREEWERKRKEEEERFAREKAEWEEALKREREARAAADLQAKLERERLLEEQAAAAEAQRQREHEARRAREAEARQEEERKRQEARKQEEEEARRLEEEETRRREVEAARLRELAEQEASRKRREEQRRREAEERAQRQREAEERAQRQREEQAQRQREAEAQKQREAEEQRQREADAQRQREVEDAAQRERDAQAREREAQARAEAALEADEPPSTDTPPEFKDPIFVREQQAELERILAQHDRLARRLSEDAIRQENFRREQENIFKRRQADEQNRQRELEARKRAQEEIQRKAQAQSLREEALLADVIRRSEEEHRQEELRRRRQDSVGSTSDSSRRGPFSSAASSTTSRPIPTPGTSFHHNPSLAGDRSSTASSSSYSSSASAFSGASTRSSSTGYTSSASTARAAPTSSATPTPSVSTTKGGWKPSPATPSPSTPSPGPHRSNSSTYYSAYGSSYAQASPTRPSNASYTATSPLDEEEWTRRQEEHARRQFEQFQREQEAQQRKVGQKAARQLTKEEVVRVFEEHEKRWARIPTLDVLSWHTFPWPMLRPPNEPEQLTYHEIQAYVLSPHQPGDKTPKERIKDLLRKWHPDRFETKVLPRVREEEREQVKEGAGNVARHLNKLLSSLSASPENGLFG